MDKISFYKGEALDAWQFLGAHADPGGTVFRVYAPGAKAAGIIGDFTGAGVWREYPLRRKKDGIFERRIIEARAGMMYKIRIHTAQGKAQDHCDPYGFQSELRPGTASVIYDHSRYTFADQKWMAQRTDGRNRPVNIYEIHPGSWRKRECRPSYEETARELVPYLQEYGYNYVELMPVCEYPCDESWGYQAVGFYSATARYGNPDGLKRFVDICHQAGIGVILDMALVHFAVDAFGLARFDGTPLYEYPYEDIEYNQWGSKNFNHARPEVRSFLQSAVCYWIEQFHMDGIRMDAVSNLIYWQGNRDRGVNEKAVEFLQRMNTAVKSRHPDVMLIAEDSTAYPKVTAPAKEGGLGFDYKWDMGWMNDTLAYMRENPADRSRDYHKLTFSMYYFYSERFLMPLSHDEVVHQKATILQKMYGEYEDKFSQARALYMYMYAHPGKQLNFMGNELGQFREWDERREQDWMLLDFPKHDAFHQFMKQLNHLYLDYPAFYQLDYEYEGFQWTDCTGDTPAVYSFVRRAEGQTILAVFNFSGKACRRYRLPLDGYNRLRLLLDSEWDCYGGTLPKAGRSRRRRGASLQFSLQPFHAQFYLLQ